MVSISFFFGHLYFLPLKKFYTVFLLIASLNYWFFGSLVFWAPCKYWLLIPCQMNSWQLFFSFWGQPSQFSDAFLCWTASYFHVVSPICQSFLLIEEVLEFYLGSYRICSYVPLYSLFFPAVASKTFIFYLKVFDPLWIDIYTGWKTRV
jgi:hypothetical protein